MLNITDHIFYPLDGNFKNKIIHSLQVSEIDFINELATFSQKYSLISEIIDNKMIWKDQNNAIQLILHFNIKAHELNKILDIYRYTRHHQETVKALEKECNRNNLNQFVEEEFIFWTDKQDNIKCMFIVVYDPSNIDTFIKLYSKIIEKNIRLTYCIVNQFPDGSYEFDIFRLSEMSYLEHYNRVRPSSTDLYHLIK
jgi:hypothetical protein